MKNLMYTPKEKNKPKPKPKKRATPLKLLSV